MGKIATIKEPLFPIDLSDPNENESHTERVTPQVAYFHPHKDESYAYCVLVNDHDIYAHFPVHLFTTKKAMKAFVKSIPSFPTIELKLAERSHNPVLFHPGVWKSCVRHDDMVTCCNPSRKRKSKTKKSK